MAGQLKSGGTGMNRLITRAWHALAGRGGAPRPSEVLGPLRMSDIHPPGSCARDSRPTDFSDLFAPEAPDSEKEGR